MTILQDSFIKGGDGTCLGLAEHGRELAVLVSQLALLPLQCLHDLPVARALLLQAHKLLSQFYFYFS